MDAPSRVPSRLLAAALYSKPKDGSATREDCSIGHSNSRAARVADTTSLYQGAAVGAIRISWIRVGKSTGAAPASERTLCRAALLLGRTRLRRFRRLGLHRSLLLLVLVLLTLVTHHAVLSQGPIRGAAIGRGRVLCGFERIVMICISVYLRSIDPVTIGPARQRSLRVLSDGRWLLLHPCVPMIHLAKEEL